MGRGAKVAAPACQSQQHRWWQLMRFEGRDLKPYTESVSASELRVGSVYFTIVYFDDEMTIPDMLTLVFIGTANSSQSPDGKPQLCQNGNFFVFQNAASYYFEDEPGFYKTFTAEELAGVCVFDEALNSLLRCSLRLKTKDGRNTPN